MATKIPSAFARKANYVTAMHRVAELCRRAIVAAESINPLDAATGELAFKSLTDITEAIEGVHNNDTAFHRFVEIFLPKGAEMELHLRSTNCYNEVTIQGGSPYGSRVYFLNHHSDKQNGIYIGTLLGYGAYRKSDTTQRVANLNRQLGQFS